MAKDKDNFVKIDRGIITHPIATKDHDYFFLWMYLLCNAAWKEHEILFHGKQMTLKPGQLPPTGRKKLSKETGIQESKVERILKAFENEQMIEQQTNSQNRLISIVSWNTYQICGQPSEQQMNNERTTSEQRVNTTEESKKGIREKNYYISYSTSEEQPVKTLDSLRNKYNSTSGLTAPEEWFLEGSR